MRPNDRVGDATPGGDVRRGRSWHTHELANGGLDPIEVMQVVGVIGRYRIRVEDEAARFRLAQA